MMLWILAIFLSASAINYTDLSYNVTVNSNVTKNHAKFYLYTVPDNTNRSIISTIILGQLKQGNKDDPDVYIAFKEFSAEDSYKKESKISCTTYGEDLCPITGDDFYQKDVKVYIAITSEGDCAYKITIINTTVVEINAEYNSITIPKEEVCYYSFHASSEIKRIVASFKLYANVDISPNIRMFMSPKTIPDCNYSTRALQMWNGYISKYTSDDKSFCNDCMYYIALFSHKTLYGEIFLELNKDLIPAYSSSLYLVDVLTSSKERNCYVLNLESEFLNESIELYLSPFFGNPDIYVNPKYLPEEREGFQFKSEGKWDEYLSITPKERNNTSGVYYVCVYGTKSVYEVFSNFYYSEEDLYIGDGMTRTQHIEKDDLIVMKYSISPDQEGTLTGQLITRSGNADLYAIQCPDFEESCELTKNMISSKNKTVLRSENELGIDEINMSIKKCKEGCYVLFGVLSKNSSTEFSLTASFDGKSHIFLENNEALYGYIKYNHFDYYYFYIFEELEDQIEKITLQLTSYSGDADLFLSRNEMYPDREHSDSSSQNDYYMSDTIIYDTPPYAGEYYIAVKGASSSYYALQYRIDIKADKPDENNIITLVDGLPQSFTMEMNDSALNFTFKVYGKQSFDVMLTPEKGKFKMYMDYEKKQTLDAHRWSGSTFIHLDGTDSDFVGDKYYILRVFTQTSLLDIYYKQKSKFSIVFKTSQKCSILEASMPTYGEVNKNEYAFYQFPIVKTNLNVSISLTDYSGDPNLIVSVHPNNKFPSIDKHDKISSNVGNDNMIVEWKDIINGNKACSDGDGKCMIYLSIFTSNEHSDYLLLASYSLSHTFVPLLDGMPIEDQCKDQNIYYIIGANHTALLKITRQTGDVDIYIGVVDTIATPDKQYWAVPTNSTASYVPALKANVYSVKLYSCDSCAFVISITPKPQISAISTFSIIYTIFEAEYLSEGLQTISSVGNNQYIYYEFYAYCENCTLSISITPITNGNPDLYVLYGGDEKPTHINYHFKSSSPAGDFLQITPNDPIFEDMETGIQGSYIIGVYGQKECTFSIMATTSENNVISLANGIPYTIHNEIPMSNISISYQHITPSSLSINLNMLYGEAYILANVIEDIYAYDVLEHLPTNALHTWSSKESNNPSNLIISNKDPKFKANALYLITIVSVTESIYTALLSDYSSFMVKFNEPMKMYINKNQTQIVSFVPDEDIDIEIIPTVFKGSFKYYLMSESTTDYKKAIASAHSCCESIIFKSTNSRFNKTKTYFVVMIGEEDGTDFNLLLSVKFGITNIMDGMPLNFMLTKENPKMLLGYNSYFSNNLLSINVQATDAVAVYVTRCINSKVTENDYPSESSHNFKFEYNSLTMAASGIVQLLDTDQQQLVLINIELQSESSDVEVVAWSRDRVSLFSESPLQNTLYNTTEAHTYEIIVEKEPGYLSVASCGGKAIYRIYESINSKKVANSVATTEGISVLPKKGKYYVVVKQDNSDPNYVMDYRVLFKENITYENLIQRYSPVSDYIDWDWDNGDIEISWSPLYFLNLKDRREEIYENITYYLYISPNLTDGIIGVCPTHRLGMLRSIGSTNETHIKVAFPDIKARVFYIMIYAYVPKANDYLTYKVTTAYRFRTRIWGKVILFLLIVAVGLACWFYIRMKRLQNKIQMEMSDVRNMKDSTAQNGVKKVSAYESISSSNK